MEIGHAGLLLWISRQKFNLPEILEPGSHTQLAIPGAILPTLAAQLAAATPSGGAFHMEFHLDQADQTIGYMLSPPKIIELLEAWRVRDNDGEEPIPGLENWPQQISALHSRLTAMGCPHVDFGIWRPHGEDFQRAMQFTAHVCWRMAQCTCERSVGQIRTAVCRNSGSCTRM